MNGRSKHLLYVNHEEFKIKTLGECRLNSPLACENQVSNEELLIMNRSNKLDCSSGEEPDEYTCNAFELAGPRNQIYFDPNSVRMAIVTCGSLCPGINNIIRGIVLCAWQRYGCRRTIGYKFGFRGLVPQSSDVVELDPDIVLLRNRDFCTRLFAGHKFSTTAASFLQVSDIHKCGGSILGSSREPQDVTVMVDFLKENNIDIIFCIGGRGTQRGALAISDECMRRGLAISCVGVLKTIGNDIPYCEQSFGFATAVSLAQGVIHSVYEEICRIKNGIGIVKLMGKRSGFVVLYACLASMNVDLALLPEVNTCYEKVSEWVIKRFKRGMNCCLIVTAEGAGRPAQAENITLGTSGEVHYECTGRELKDTLQAALNKKKMEHQFKCVDPSYIIRSAPANPADCILSLCVAQMAVHAALAGKTALAIGKVDGKFVHIPLAKCVSQKKSIDTKGPEFQALMDHTCTPLSW